MSLPNLFIATQIVLVGLAIYRVESFLRRHRTWELAMVFLVFTGLMIVAMEFAPPPQLRRTLPIFLTAFCILMAIEPELSSLAMKLFESFNPNSLIRKPGALSEIVQAAGAMAATKTGALIAFERNDSLLKFGDTGIEINAEIKKELLTTLFTKDTPTHDGGLLIRKGRASHCGAVFPLSERRQIENGLGTRHRAALGLTEKTDAVCLVVSEEEGTISLAKRGELFYSVPQPQLERSLKKLLGGKNGPQFYPLHYIKHFSPKRAESHFLQFSKSIGERIYEFVVAVFWLFILFLWYSYGKLNLSDFQKPFELFLNQPLVSATAILLTINTALLLTHERITISAVASNMVRDYRFIFLSIFRKKYSRDHLKAVTLKREGSGMNLWSLGFARKKRKSMILDRSSAGRALADTAKKIRDVLKIELISQP